MAFALKSFFADAVRYQGPGPYRSIQKVVLTATGTIADVNLDIDDDSGTFWTDAIAANPEMATQVLDEFKRILQQCATWSAVYSPEIDASGLRGAAPASGVYTLSFSNKRPNWTFYTNEGLTSYTIFLEYELAPNMLPINYSSNIQV